MTYLFRIRVQSRCRAGCADFALRFWVSCFLRLSRAAQAIASSEPLEVRQRKSASLDRTGGTLLFDGTVAWSSGVSPLTELIMNAFLNHPVPGFALGRGHAGSPIRAHGIILDRGEALFWAHALHRDDAWVL